MLDIRTPLAAWVAVKEIERSYNNTETPDFVYIHTMVAQLENSNPVFFVASLG